MPESCSFSFIITFVSSETRRKSNVPSGSDTELSLSTDDEVAPVEKDYDSDKDPAWRPSALVKIVFAIL